MKFKRIKLTRKLVWVLAFAAIAACRDNKTTEKDQSANDEPKTTMVEVITSGMDFDLVEEINSGWTTFKYINNSYEPHFFVFEKMPDGVGYEQYTNELLPPFKKAFELLGKGDIEAGMKAFENIPAWFSEVQLSGGVGLTSPQSVTESTIYMEPGTYIMECYVRMPNGTPHTFMGMYKELKVNSVKNTSKIPQSDHSIGVSSASGITFVDSLSAGSYNLKVNFIDQSQYEHFMGHDINLVKIENDSLIKALGSWLNANDMTALRSPAPEGLTFLGGVEDLNEGDSGYFKVSLDKGTYVLISEIPNVIDRNMYKVFKVY